MAMLRTLLGLSISALLIELALAATYTVGGPNGGWDQMTDLKTWASSQSFFVGDNLSFQYAPNHNVLEVSKTDYDSCQTSTPLKTDNGGNTVIPLSSPAKRYFICGTAGHCSQGMKVEIETLAAATAPAPAPASQITPGSPPEPAPGLAPSPPSKARASSPASSPSSDDAPTASSSPNSSPPPPSPSSANKDNVKSSLVMGFGLVMTMILAF